MKSKKFTALLLAMTMMFSLTACGAPTPSSQNSASISQSKTSSLSGSAPTSEAPASVIETPKQPEQDIDIDYAFCYDWLLCHYARLLASGEYDDKVFSETDAIVEAAAEFGESALGRVGYALRDINDDGLSELIVGAIKQNSESSSELFGLYTPGSDELNTPVIVAESNMNELYYWADGGIIKLWYGGTHECIGSYILPKRAGELSCTDFYYYSLPRSENSGGWHNVSGEVETTEDHFLSQQELNAGMQKLSDSTTPMEWLTPFSEFHNLESALLYDYGVPDSWKNANGDAPALQVGWADELLDTYPEWTELTLPKLEGHGTLTKIAFAGNVRDFRFLSLEMIDYTDAGPVFHITEEYYAEELTQPLSVGVFFGGSLPSWGVSYTEENGRQRSYYVIISGKDGSLMMVEF